MNISKSKTNIVIIDDDLNFRNEPFIIEAELLFDTVHFFDNPFDGLKFIEKEINNPMIVLLDLSFPTNLPDGHKVLDSIRKWSFLIPVIIWSGKDEDKETFSDLINNKSFSYLKKSASTEEIIKELTKADSYIHNSVDNALEEWISAHDEEVKQQPYLITANGKQLSLNDVLKEIRMQSDIGLQLSRNILKLTIDLIARNKENING